MRKAACGLICEECNLYRAQFDLQAAQNLVGWFRQRGWIGADEGADAIMAKVPYCMGCWENGVNWCGECHLRSCCDERTLSTCGACSEFPCKDYVAWTVDTPHHIEAMNKLLAQRK